jgi:hypothetical protein
MPSLIVLNDDAVPSIYWQPSEPRLKLRIPTKPAVHSNLKPAAVPS